MNEQPMVEEYSVVAANALMVDRLCSHGLVTLVNQQIKLGWQPQGGVYLNEAGTYFQAMVKHAKPF